METSHEFDFAVSYAGPDQPFVSEVVSALRARGLTVFHAPDEQADMIGRNLLDYLHIAYLSRARYCLLFASKHYAERKWTNKVERPAAQERALEQDERYIIPIRLDDTRITGLSGNTLDIRNATPQQIADLCVAVMLRDAKPDAVSDDHGKRDRLIIRVTSLTELDTELLRKSFKPFERMANGNANMIPVELRLPKFFMETLEKYEEIKSSTQFRYLDLDTQKSFRQGIDSIRKGVFQELTTAPAYVIEQSQPNTGASLVLLDSAVELIRRFALSKLIASARLLTALRLRDFWNPDWASKFADCKTIWSTTVMGGLPWLCRAEGAELHLWFNADISGWKPLVFQKKVRIFRPSKLVLRDVGYKPSADEVLHFIAPQLLEQELQMGKRGLLNLAFNYPERMEITHRNEQVIECLHLAETGTFGYGCEVAHPAMLAMAEQIMDECDGTRDSIHNSLKKLHAAEFALRDNRDVILPAIQALYAMLKKCEPQTSGEGNTP